jgi:hypothetical protein
MPQVKITDAKGLFQQTGTGIVIQSVGAEGVVSSGATTIPLAVGNTDISLSMPAGALVTDFGFVVTSAVGGGSGSGTMTVSFGTAAGGGQLVAGAVVANSNAILVAGSSMSVLNAVEAVASGAPFADFVDAAALHSSSARTLHARFAQSTGVAAAAGEVIAYVKYIILK